MSFQQEGQELKQCFKCKAPDYKTCDCDNLKNVRKRKEQKKEANHMMIANENHEGYDDEMGFSFHSEIINEICSTNVENK